MTWIWQGMPPAQVLQPDEMLKQAESLVSDTEKIVERMKRIIWIVLTGLFYSLVAAQEDVQLLFDTANVAYQEGQL